MFQRFLGSNTLVIRLGYNNPAYFVVFINELTHLKIMDVPFLHTLIFQCSSLFTDAKLQIII